MDRRYNQSRAWDGTRATDNARARSEALVRQYLGRARALNYAAQSYGGSTGGQQSFVGGAGVSNIRGTDRLERGATFQEFGSGSDIGARALGGRASLAEIRGFRQGTGVSLDRPT